MVWALEFAGGAAEMLVIFPFSMRRYWSSRGAAPVPSMMRTWVRRTAGALTLTYLRTSGERVGVWAWRARGRARTAVRVRPGRMGFSGAMSLPRGRLRIFG